MRIAMCDDERQEIEQIEHLIREYAVERNYEITIQSFVSGKALLQEDKFDLYFLDYMMDEMDGISLALALKKKFNNAVTICFLTGYDNVAERIINERVYADGFLRKPVDPQQLYDKLDQFYKMSFFNRLQLKRDGRYETIYPQDILFAQAVDKKSLIYFYDCCEEYPISLSELEKKYLSPELFFRTHRSYIVNMMHIARYDKRVIVMKSGDKVELSRFKPFQEAYRNFNFNLNAQ
ncbi:MAG: response regulator transcription factor [Clostridia bacterium]|nr:response regulator transcription factor [Clostridia bacterium]